MKTERKIETNFSNLFAVIDRCIQSYILNNKIIKKRNKKIKIYNFNTPNNSKLVGDEIKRIQEEPYLNPLTNDNEEQLKKIFGKYYSKDYVRNMMQTPKLYKKDRMTLYEDFNNGVFTCESGIRITTDQPDTYVNSIYIVGACSAFGIYVEDKHTIASYLQRLINKDNYRFRIINLGSIAPSNISDLLLRINLLDGDIIVNLSCFLYGYKPTNIHYFDLSELFQSEIREECFIDSYSHFNYRGSSIIADKIYEEIKMDLVLANTTLKQNKLENLFTEEKSDKIDNYHLYKYLNDIKSKYYRKAKNSNGAIVMNCNPFTLGHLYLIDYAVKKVDNLYIFVVEENRSDFTFEERFNMIVEGVSHMYNVIVLPSGRFVISAETFPEYFEKSENTEQVIDAENDIMYFGKWIAPALDIKTRFVGTEPNDKITNQYNIKMKQRLPYYGVAVTEIPRKELCGKVISASEVRKKIKQNDYESIKKLVPKTTYNYILKMLEKNKLCQPI